MKTTMRRSESQEHLTASQAQEEPHAAVAPQVEFRGERRPVQRPNERSSSSDMPFDPDVLVVHGSSQIISLFVPVSICMLFVLVVCVTISSYSSSNNAFGSAFSTLGGGDDTTEPGPGEGVIVALATIGFIILATCFIVLCFKFRCMKFIKGYLFFSGCAVCFLLSGSFFITVCQNLGIFVDYISLSLFTWNFGLVGVFSIFWKTPLLVQQGYLIFIASQIALVLTVILPWWTTWFLLAFLAVWDLFAVLTPCGPLKILVNLIQQSDEQLPTLMVYSTAAGIAYTVDSPQPQTSGDDSNQEQNNASAAPEQAQEQAQVQAQEPSDAVNPVDEDDGGFGSHMQNTQRAERLQEAQQNNAEFTESGRARSALSALNNANQEAEELEVQMSNASRNLRDIQHEVLSRDDRGIKLGLGDFIFYSLLVAKASQSQDWSTIVAVFTAILIGMCSTLLLLAIRGHALPALPISIFFGLVFYFCTNLIITPFSASLAANQAFI